MEGEVLGEDALLQKLRDSRRRFQRHMQRLLEKYNQPFEDAPLVQMSTLTYKTPEGWRVWGGRLIKENEGQTQDSPVKAVDKKEGSVQATARGHEPPAPCTQDLGADSESSADATLYQEDLADGTLTPAVPWSPLKDELRRKYLTQLDILLQDEACSEYDDYGDGNDTRVSLAPSLALPPRPSRGFCHSVSEESLGGPFPPAASSRPCSVDMAVVPRNDSVSFQDTSGNSFLSSQSFVAADICTVTISDLYAGMLHSMSRLLSVKPSCVISTRTFSVQHWSSRRRHRWKSRMNRTYHRAGRYFQRGSRERLSPPSEPVKEVGVLRDCQNLRDASGHKAGLKLGKTFLEVNKPQIRKLDPSWKELKGTRQKLSSLTHMDSRAMHCLDRQNRLMTLKWLISPVKVVCRRRMLQGEGGNHYRELENRFDKLYQEYCLSPRKQPCLTSSSSRAHLYKGGSSPGGAWGSESHRLSRSFSKAKPKVLNEAFENLDQRAIEAGRCLARSNSFPSLSKTHPTPIPGRSELTADLLFRGNNLGIFRKSVSLSKPVSIARIQPLGGVRDRYNEIKEKFDKLHQKCCQKSPPRTKPPLYTGASPDKASVELQNQEDILGKLNPDSGFQGPQKLSPSPQRSVKRSLGSMTAVHPCACFALARSGPQPLVKRHCLSDPPVCAGRADCQRPSHTVGRADLRPGEEAGSSQPDWKKKHARQCVRSQDSDAMAVECTSLLRRLMGRDAELGLACWAWWCGQVRQCVPLLFPCSRTRGWPLSSPSDGPCLP
ncbi:Holliday junction recognition protein isoform X3 [Rhinolophus sinicus]|uniref:Holliday junction recognition protein isoform X3 n=1 Tax=Rhinolophus sinicus TaxID=89399 RepID=UPI003D7C122F